MARTTDSAIQRLQVGLIGLLVVLLFVSLATMLSDRVDNPAKTAAAGDSAQNAGGGKAASVDLGVTPVVPDQADKQQAKHPAPANNGPQR